MLTFKYRVYPSGKQAIRLNRQMQLAKEVYNILLAKSKEHYKNTGKTFSQFDMNNYIRELKKQRPEFSEVHSQVLQNVSKRINEAYKSFFRRVKEKKSGKNVKVGFPRFKKFVSSLTYPQKGFKFYNDNRLHISNIGNVTIVKHREMKGKMKTCTIKQYPSGKWYVGFSNDVIEEPFKSNKKEEIGLDMGLKSFATLSDGTKIEPPNFLRKSEKKLKILQRRVSRKNKGSNNRRNARFKLARMHEHISNQRNDFLHKLSNEQVNSFSRIVIEKLNISGMMKNHCLAKSISDISWGKYGQMLHYKAWSAGCEVMEVNPKNTSRECNICGNKQDMPLSVRTFACQNCGHTEDRDANAAKNILKKHTAGRAGIHACGDLPSTFSERNLQGISLNQELYEASKTALLLPLEAHEL